MKRLAISILPDSGINEGDVIKEIDGHKIENLKDYEKAVAAHNKDSS